jgi:FkbM family methyltransferase
MIKFVKNILFRIFGLKSYLRIVSKVYIWMIKAGFGKTDYPELFYLKEIIKPGFTCIDIGANMGYYSVFMSKFAASNGHVYAVEPVPLFAEIWKKNTSSSKNKNLTLFNYALGESEGNVDMGMPVINGEVHHGMTKVLSEGNSGFSEKFSVSMKNPDQLFAEIKKIDFIKIDVEGYESIVFKNMQSTIIRCKPLIQSELSGAENRISVINLLEHIGYKCMILKNKNLELADSKIKSDYTGDFYFKYNEKV